MTLARASAGGDTRRMLRHRASTAMNKFPALLGLLALTACTSKPPDPPQARPADVATPFDALKASEQRARNVQEVVNKRAAKEDRQIEAQQQ